MKIRFSTPVGCFLRDALISRIQDDVLPFTTCNGVDVECPKRGIQLQVTAVCPKGQAESFRKLVRHASRRPLLAGRKRRR